MFSAALHQLRSFTTLRCTTTTTTTTTTSSWNLHLRELAKQGLFKEGLQLYKQMLHLGHKPNTFTFPFALKSCASLSLPITGLQLHSHVIQTGCQHDPYVHSSLISMYSKCSLIPHAHQVFEESPHSLKQLVVCYNALLAGYALNSLPFDALTLFRQMVVDKIHFNDVTMLGVIPACTFPEHVNFGLSLHGCSVKFALERIPAVANCLLTMYVRYGCIDLAKMLFDSMPQKELISWNAIISGCAQIGLATSVLDLYNAMVSSGVDPDAVTLVSVLSSCAHLGAQSIGCEVEKRIGKSGFGLNSYLRNALINMYARCGNLTRARKLFEEMPDKNIISWTAIIVGYGMHGHGETAVQFFHEMLLNGIRPDKAAFVSVLSACSHAGLTDRGLEYFLAMKSDYGINPGLEHYACVVDLLGRAGRLEEARKLISSMPIEPDGAVWGALLGACKIHKNVELAELAFERFVQLEPTNVGYYVLLSNLYSETGNLEGVARIRIMMRGRKLRKEPGCSYVEHDGKVHLFVVGDRDHPQCNEIYKMLDKLECLIDVGSSKKNDLKNLFGINGSERTNNKDKKEEIITGTGVHSEKLAVAFGLLNTEQGKEIVVMKNLRVCGDCHLFIKLCRFKLQASIFGLKYHHFRMLLDWERGDVGYAWMSLLKGISDCCEHWYHLQDTNFCYK